MIRDIIKLGYHIDIFLSIYFKGFETTNKIYCLRKNKNCILFVVDCDKSKTTIFVHNLLISKNDVILQSYNAKKIIKDMNDNILGYIDSLLKQGYMLSVITK